ncbi:MAG: hypothetical protein ACE5JQ_00860 [Candidatus Methylomirabilales bacterium]
MVQFRWVNWFLVWCTVTLATNANAQAKLSFVSSTSYQHPMIAQFSPKEFSQRFVEIAANKAIVIDVKNVHTISGQLIRELIVKQRPLFLLDPKNPPQVLFKMFDIYLRIFSVRKESVEEAVRAAGIFRRNIGTYYTINLIGSRAVPVADLIPRIDAAADRMLRVDAIYPVVPRTNGQEWEDDGTAHEEDLQDSNTKGIFRQRVSISILRNDRSATSDWWYLHMYNEVEPARPAYMTKLNRNQATGVHVIGLPCWGPRGIVDSQKRAEVAVGCPGPEVPWDWPTGFTMVRDRTKQSQYEAAWDVEFSVGQNDSKASHKWEPGAQYETRETRNKELTIRMDVFVEWRDQKKNIIPWELRPWEYVSRPPR